MTGMISVSARSADEALEGNASSPFSSSSAIVDEYSLIASLICLESLRSGHFTSSIKIGRPLRLSNKPQPNGSRRSSSTRNTSVSWICSEYEDESQLRPLFDEDRRTFR